MEQEESENMGKLKNGISKFYNKHFVKWKFLQSLIVIPYEMDGKKYLHISQVCMGGTRVVKRTFLIEHLVDDNLAVTDQTLAEKKRVFKNPTLF